MIARGLGRSYNNAAQCDGGVVISTARLNRILDLDPDTGLATCEAGVSLEQLMVAGLPAGWFVPVSPGTRQVTVGGAIAADVHGKNHHVAGSFARHVRSADIVLPGGELRTVTERSDPELFWATTGGMGLTGLIVRAVIQLKRVATARIRVDTVRTADIDETMAVLAEHDTSFGYTVAWSDSLARGARLGRSVVTSGDFAEPADLPAADRADPFAFRPGARLGVPPRMPPGLINRYSVAWPTRPTTAARPAPGRASCRPSARSSTRWTRSGTGTASTGPAASGSTSTWCRSARRPRCAVPSSWSAGPAPPPS